MPSIFIWKADTLNTSKKSIKYYSGSNWILEDGDNTSKSYIYLEQIVISESDNSVITFNCKDMPKDWVGSELLEISNVPYEIIKSDEYGILEKVGVWIRFTLKKEIEFNENNLKSELINIKIWKDNKESIKQETINNIMDLNTINLNFQQFLNKYKLPPVTNIILGNI